MIVIKLLKSYFTNPNPTLMKVRGLATLEEYDEYYIIREDIPR